MDSIIIFDIQHALRMNDTHLAFEILEFLPLPAPFDVEYSFIRQGYWHAPLHEKRYFGWNRLSALVNKIAEQYYQYADLYTLGERFFYFGDYEMAAIAWRSAYFSKDCPNDTLNIKTKIGMATQKATQFKYNFLVGMVHTLREYVTEKQVWTDHEVAQKQIYLDMMSTPERKEYEFQQFVEPLPKYEQDFMAKVGDKLEMYLKKAQKTAAIHLDFIENPNTYPVIRLKIDKMPSSIEDLTDLESIHLDEQYLTNYNFLNLLPHLKALSFRQSSCLDKAIDFSFLQNLSQLTHLDLHGNQLTDIYFLQSLTCLTHLNLGRTGFNRLEYWDLLQQLSQLTHLNLDGNGLQDLSPLRFLTKLKVLHLNDNEIEAIAPLQSLTQLTELYLNNNGS